VRAWAGITSVRDAELKIKDKYREHYALVRRVTPPERLVEFKLSDGWKPLCEFLGKPIPDKEFPYYNNREYFDEKVKVLMSLATKRPISKASMVLVPATMVAAAYYLYMYTVM
jgi:hypothetical protein